MTELECPAARDVRGSVPWPRRARSTRIAAASLLLIGGASTCVAEGAPPATPDEETATAPPPRRPAPFSLRFTADAWLPRLEGNSSNGGAAYDLGDTFGLDDIEASIDGLLLLQFERWQFALSGFDFSAGATADVPPPSMMAPTGSGTVRWGELEAPVGTSLHSRFEIASAALEVGYDLWAPLSDQRFPWSEPSFNVANVADTGGYRVDLRVAPMIGLRWTGIEESHTDAMTGSGAAYDGDWIALYGGFRFLLEIAVPETVPLPRRFAVTASGGFGGVVSGASGTYWQVRAGLEVYLVERVAVSIGYQLVEFDADDGAYAFDGGLQGLWAGMSIAF